MFNYTSRLVVGFARYDTEIKKELSKKLKEGEIPTKVLQNDSYWKGGYKARYPDTWEEVVKNAVDKSFCCVKELIDHIWSESNALYAGTDMADKFMVYHDHLSTMWEKGAKSYMKAIGMWDRLIKISDPNNALVHSRYKDSLPGDSPENARATESHMFADLMVLIYKHVAITGDYVKGDIQKFSLATPILCYSAMIRIWKILPSSRIIQDIYGWPAVLAKMVEAKGCIIMGEFFRTERRARKADDSGFMKTKFESRSRKSSLQESNTHSIVHEDAERGKASILAFGLAEYQKEMQAIEECTHEIMVRSDQHAYDKEAMMRAKKKESPQKGEDVRAVGCERSGARNFLLCTECFRRYVRTYVRLKTSELVVAIIIVAPIRQ